MIKPGFNYGFNVKTNFSVKTAQGENIGKAVLEVFREKFFVKCMVMFEESIKIV